MTVTAVLVSHAGARWLPTVLEGLTAQTRAVDQVVAVDTGSKDESAALLRAALGDAAVVETSRATSFPQAVDLALAAEPVPMPVPVAAGSGGHGARRGARADAGAADEWIWLLHDDSTPDPEALDWLLAAAAEHPDVDIFGPKLREWPSLRRILEVGVTISGTGRRETGLERGEYDQGQHDDLRPVLAVNTAGLLVRRSVLERLGGFDDQLPVFGNDIDFGWRAAWAGVRTMVVPPAVVFHAEAAHRGVRRTPLTGRHTHYQERRAALYTLLVNGRGVWWRALRLIVGSLLRMLGLLLVRSPGQALDELAALLSLYARPGQIVAARRARKPLRTAEPASVQALLAPWWLPYRHGLDAISDVASAVAGQAQDVADRRRAARIEAGELPPPVLEDDDEFAVESGPIVRFLTSPVALAATALVVAALIAGRTALGSVVGPALSPAPEGVGAWWSLWAHAWQPLGQGTDLPAMPYVLVLALLGSVLGGPGPAVSAVLLLAVPLGIWGAFRLLRVAARLVHPEGAPSWVLLAGAAAWGLLPMISGAWGEGRLATVAAVAALPWVAHAALGFADPEADRRRRAGWRTGLLLALAAAFVPLLWLLALLIVLLLVVAVAVADRTLLRDRSWWGPPALALAVGPVLLSPWLVPLLVGGPRAALLAQAGRLPVAPIDTWDFLAGRVAGPGAPIWLGAGLLALAVLALVPRRTRGAVGACWLVAVAAAGLATALSHLRLELPAAVTTPGIGLLVIVVPAAAVVAVVIALTGLRHGTDRSRLVLVPAGALLALVPLIGIGWMLGGGSSELSDRADSDIPAYMQQDAELGPAHGIVVLRGSVDDGLDYEIRRGDGPTVGEDEILAAMPSDPELTSAIRTLVTRPTEADVAQLADLGIEYVVMPAPADVPLAATLDSAPGLAQASAQDRDTRAWQVALPLADDAVDGSGPWWRTALLILQVLALTVTLVLCGPSRPRSSREVEA